MKPRPCVCLLAIIVCFFVAPLEIRAAQQGARNFRIGFLSAGGGDVNNPGPTVEIFRQGLRALGYVEGQNLNVEYRFSNGRDRKSTRLNSSHRT